LLVCNEIHMNDDIVKRLPFGITAIVETKDGPVKIGGRSMRIFKVN